MGNVDFVVVVKTKDIDFVVTKCPNIIEMDNFVENLKINNVNILIRIIKESYEIREQMPDLIVKELYFKDGEYPTNEIINEYSAFIIECKKKFTRPIIAIHCVSSLGRAPCIIALQMIQEGNKDRFYIIEYIRSNIRGAFNIKQLNWVLDFKLKSKSVLSSFFKCF